MFVRPRRSALRSPHQPATNVGWGVQTQSWKSLITMKTIFQASGISKHYGTTCALRDANLVLKAGQIHALMGENGAGKSTFVKILVGAIRPDGGALVLDGQPVVFGSVRDALKQGVVPVYQHSTLFTPLTVLENLSAFGLGSAQRSWARNNCLDRQQATEVLSLVGLDVSLDSLVDELSLGERQLLEIARGVGRRCSVLILDEPTAALGAREADRLHQALQVLCAKGTAILYISHKIDDIKRMADAVTILRDGLTVVNAAARDDISAEQIVQHMLGQTFEPQALCVSTRGEVVLEAKDIRLTPTAQPLSLCVHQGEVLGIVGVAGSGALRLGEVLAGAASGHGGTVSLNATSEVVNDRQSAMRAGIGYVPSDRHADGLFLGLSALQNASASVLRGFSSWGVLRLREEAGPFDALIAQFNLNPPRLDLDAAYYSGGNQQKLLFLRNLVLPNLRVLVVLEPTRGVDVGARESIHQALRALACRGIAIIVVSSDLLEVNTLCHQLLVVASHQVAGRMMADAQTDAVLSMMAGAC